MNKEIKIPDNGILLTSSSIKDDIIETNIKTNSGIHLNSEKSKKGFTQIEESEIEFKHESYKFRTWKISDNPCCHYTLEEIDEHKKN